MADEGADWFADTGDDAPPPAKSLFRKSEDLSASGKGGLPGEDKRPQAEDEYVNPHKLLLFKHWIRPRFPQYRYLYNYSHSYYDDILDYLDMRERGLRREMPRPQTWAERVLRTYNSDINKIESFRRLVEDTKMVTKSQISGYLHLYRSKSYITRRYSSISA